MNKFLILAVLALAVGLLFSCTSDIESAENILGNGDSSSSLGSSGFSSSSSFLPGGSTFCRYAAGCAEISADACSAFGGTVVASCPVGVSSSSLLAGVSSSSIIEVSSSSPFGVLSSSSISGSSSSLQSGSVFCMSVVGCAEMPADACVTFGGEVVASCPVSSSSFSLASSSSAIPIVQSSSSITSSSSYVAPSSSSSIPPPQSSSSGGSEPSEGANHRIECTGSFNSDCKNKTVNLKAGECVEIAVLDYNNYYHFPNVGMECRCYGGDCSSFTLDGVLPQQFLSTGGYFEVSLGKIKQGDNELGTLCFKGGTIEVSCNLIEH